MNAADGYKRPAIAGSGVVATGLAATATMTGKTVLLARSDASAWRAEEQAVAACSKVEGSDASNLRVTTDQDDVSGCDLVIESVIEDAEVKASCWADLATPPRRPTSRQPPRRCRLATWRREAAIGSESLDCTSSIPSRG